MEEKFSGAFDRIIYSENEQEDIDYLDKTYIVIDHRIPRNYDLGPNYEPCSDIQQGHPFEISLDRLADGYIKKNIINPPGI